MRLCREVGLYGEVPGGSIPASEEGREGVAMATDRSRVTIADAENCNPPLHEGTNRGCSGMAWGTCLVC